jgi:hypothetical protein
VRERFFLGEQRPIAIERPRIKKADPAVIGFEGTTRDTALISQMEEIGANLLLAEHLSGSNREDQSTDAGHRGGAARRRDEGSVMELDQRGCVVQPRPWANRQREEPVDVAKPFNIPKRVV